MGLLTERYAHQNPKLFRPPVCVQPSPAQYWEPIPALFAESLYRTSDSVDHRAVGLESR